MLNHWREMLRNFLKECIALEFGFAVPQAGLWVQIYEHHK